MATKRRKVWVNIHDGGDNGDYATAWLNSKAAKNNSGVRVRAVAVPMVERLPGDVVLSREEAAAVDSALLKAAGYVPPDSSVFQAVLSAGALLRGRR